MLNWKTGGPLKSFLVDGKIHQKASDIANIQMDYFRMKLLKIKITMMNTGNDPLQFLKLAFETWKLEVDIPTFKTKNISLQDTVKLIGQLSNNTSYGNDGIDAFFYQSSH